MAVFDARPSAFTQLSTVAEWEYYWAASGGVSAVDASYLNAFSTGFDIPGRNLILNAGNACVRGQLWRCDSAVNVPIPAASAQDRLDRIVLRLNRGAATAATVITPTIITGTPSGSPALPALVRTPTGIWDFPIAYWTSQSTGGLTSRTDNRELLTNDTWHEINTPAGWSGTVAYKMNRDQTVSIAGQPGLPPTGSYNAVVIATLPKIYWPSGDKHIPFVVASGATYGASGLPQMTINSDGRVQLSGIPSGLNGVSVWIDGIRYPLDF